MALSDLISSLRIDLADPQTRLFSDEVLGRCILKSAFPVGRDLALNSNVQGGEISPEPTGEALEMLLLLAQIHACQYMRAATASNFSFSSGDKRVDKTKTPEHWSKLEADLRSVYQQRLSEIQPDSAMNTDNYIFTPAKLEPVIFEQGSE